VSLKVGDKVRWKDRTQLAALAMGEHVVMTVVAQHPRLPAMWKVRGPDGHEDWVRPEWVWVVKAPEEPAKDGITLVLSSDLTEEQKATVFEVLGDLFESVGGKGGLEIKRVTETLPSGDGPGPDPLP
jgi:hypothetical protein